MGSKNSGNRPSLLNGDGRLQELQTEMKLRALQESLETCLPFLELYQNDMSMSAIARKFGVTFGVVHARLKKAARVIAAIQAL